MTLFTRTDQATHLRVERVAGRHRATIRGGLLRAQVMGSDETRCRVALIATTALLLGGDKVEIEIEVGPGAMLDLYEVAGTVAYDGKGNESSWQVRIRLEEDAALRWRGEPFVVSAGADIDRMIMIHCADRAEMLIRDTVVLGRSGEVGGRLRNRTMITNRGRPVMLEDQQFDRPTRELPGILGERRIIDSIISIGRSDDLSAIDAPHFRLANQGGDLIRYLGCDLASSPLHEAWAALIR